jgi:Lysine-specific metallo-endopeptidase
MPIMSHAEWKTRVKEPGNRSLEFVNLDRQLQEYGNNPGSWRHFEALYNSLKSWLVKAQAGAEYNACNTNKAVEDLIAQTNQFVVEHQPFREAGLRDPRFLQQVRMGAALRSQGGLKPEVKVLIPLHIRDTFHGTVIWEGFDDMVLPIARIAWWEAYSCARLASEAMGKVETGDDKEEERFRRWFGRPNEQVIRDVKDCLEQMWGVFKNSPVTIVWRPGRMGRCVNIDQPFAPMTPDNRELFGVTHWLSPGDAFHAGSGYRVIAGPLFFQQDGPLRPVLSAACTIYHELSHQVLNAKDHRYGRIRSRGLAIENQIQAIWNADNYALYAISFREDS